MNLLLLLSALLSALTGVQFGARAQSATVAVSQPVQAAATAGLARVRVAGGRPIVAPPTRPVSLPAGSLAGWRLAAAVPLYASRRRE